ncbi:MAG: hypothetical protein H6620_09830 [Halobacteriovoraceae bacterium]|nr:hypothetical protein [Halobacteriovoraceae bacterium]
MKSFFLVSGLALLFTGCASYKAKPLDDFTDTKTSFSEEKNLQLQASN